MQKEKKLNKFHSLFFNGTLYLCGTIQGRLEVPDTQTPFFSVPPCLRGESELSGSAMMQIDYGAANFCLPGLLDWPCDFADVNNIIAHHAPPDTPPDTPPECAPDASIEHFLIRWKNTSRKDAA